MTTFSQISQKNVILQYFFYMIWSLSKNLASTLKWIKITNKILTFWYKSRFKQDPEFWKPDPGSESWAKLTGSATLQKSHVAEYVGKNVLRKRTTVSYMAIVDINVDFYLKLFYYHVNIKQLHIKYICYKWYSYCMYVYIANIKSTK